MPTKPLPTVTDLPKPPQTNRTISSGDVLSRTQNLAHGTNQFDGYCADFVQRAAMGNSFSPQGNAGDWYNKVNRQGAVNTTVAPPAGTAVFYDTSNANDHVAISAGNNYVWSTGINGKIQKVPMDNLYGGGAGSTLNRGWTSRFGNQYVNYNGTASSGKPSGTSTTTAKSASRQGSTSSPKTSAPSASSTRTTFAPSASLVSLAPITGPTAFTSGSRNLNAPSISAPKNPLINSED